MAGNLKIYECEKSSKKHERCENDKKHNFENGSLAGDHKHDGGNPCTCSVGGVAF